MEDVRLMIFVHYCVSASFLMTLLKFMIPLNYKFFKTLYQIQRHEFYSHAPREIPLAIITTGCVIAIFVMDFLVLFYFSCHILDEDEHAKSGICHQFTEGDLVPWLNNQDHVTYVFVIMLFEICVFISFLALRKPHDCFKCFSINKNTRFSVF